MNSSINYTSLAELIITEDGTQNSERIAYLVRILKRSSTLPKVEDIIIQTVDTPSFGFKITPGVSISIGLELLTKPRAALLCLRYGLEWQMWYKNQPQENYDPRICDLAASRVATKFHQLTPLAEKSYIDEIPVAVAQSIKKFEANDDAAVVASTIDFTALKSFHGEKTPTTPIVAEVLNDINHLASPIEYLMMSGGDVRLNVDSETLLNKYGCRPFPRPDAFSFASSTASSISNYAYNKAQIKRKELIKASLKQGFSKAAPSFSKALRKQIHQALGLRSTITTVLSPSGTDASLLVAGICQAVFDKEIVHILVAADETGSGVPAALQGLHFSNITSQGASVEKGALVDGFRPVTLEGIKLRDGEGKLKQPQTVDEEVYHTVKRVFKEGKQPVLHAIDQSKLGYNAPSGTCLKKLKNEFGDQLLVIIDNSQMRMDPEDIRSYLDEGYMMILTGSKFFTGPPFNGALLIPEQLSVQWKDASGSLPKGLKKYTYKNDWPNFSFTQKLKTGINLGMNMRWYASLSEIERYYQTPLSLRYLGLELFCNHVKKSIDDSRFLQHLPGFNKETKKGFNPLKMRERKTIFPFFVKFEDRVLHKDELDRLYRLLNKNLTQEFEQESDDVRRLAAQVCHIGQPVATMYEEGTASGVLRINLGARVISESWKDRDSSMFFKTIEEQMIQIDIIIRKIELLLSRPDLLQVSE